MSIFEGIKIAVASLTSNKLRSFLTMLGIIIGIGSVITLQSIGEGVVDKAQQAERANGSNLVTITQARQSYGGITLSNGNSSLTSDDVTALADTSRITRAEAIAPETRIGGLILYGSKNTFGETIGTNEQYPKVRELKLAAGDWFNDTDIAQARKVAVIGSKVAETLFGSEDPLNKSVKVNGVSFTVIGVLKSKGSAGFRSVDSQMFTPVLTVQRLLTGFRPAGSIGVGKTVDSIVIKAKDTASVDILISQVNDLLRERHKINPGQTDDFEVENQQDLLKAARDQSATYTIFLLVIASISLLVGGIGIMNIMLVNVTERTREIGIRKAVGASSLDILLQFIIESVCLCLIGGLMGVGIGIGSALLVGKYVPQLPTLLNGGVVMIAVASAVLIGLFFGIYPARRASKLNPIDALRYE